MSTESYRTAPGQMAGYLFQPDRALVLLCSCKKNQSVSIEVVDDIAAIDEGGRVFYIEQDKNSIREKGRTFTDRSKDLWNTLFVWITDIQNGRIDIENTKLVCVTNKELSIDSLIRKISNATESREIEMIMVDLKQAAHNPPSGLKSIINKVLADEDTLKQMLNHITLIDGNSLDERNEEIANSLGLNDDIRDDVIIDLRGWLNDCVYITCIQISGYSFRIFRELSCMKNGDAVLFVIF